MHEKQQALFVSKRATHRWSVHRNGRKPRTRRPNYVRFASLVLFASRLSSQRSAMNTDTRSELRASSPASRPSSSPSRGTGASAASSLATDCFNSNPDQWEGKVSNLLGVLVVYLRILPSKNHNMNWHSSQRAPVVLPR